MSTAAGGAGGPRRAEEAGVGAPAETLSTAGASPALADVVVPTVGRPSLAGLLESLSSSSEASPGIVGQVLVVDDRRRPEGPLPLVVPPGLEGRVHLLGGAGAGPAAARNVGWRASDAGWVAFLDDDVVPGPGWASALAGDVAGLGPDVGGSQGHLEVPLPVDRRPTDWERNQAGLACARWATADMAYRRRALAAVGGFDERFPRAYREDADLALRVLRAGWRLVRGRRLTVHPVRPAPFWVSLAVQAGNADDALMSALHGRDWHQEAGAPPGRFRRHLAVSASGLGAVAAGALGRPGWAVPAGLAWALGTCELAWARIAPGPRTRGEVAAMAATSAVLPPLACYHRLVGMARACGAGAWTGPASSPSSRGRPAAVLSGRPAAVLSGRPAAVLFDRDGTLVRDVPYNGDPGRVEPMPAAKWALDRVREAGIPVAVVSNQSGVARGLLDQAQVDAVNRRVEEILGPVAAWAVCPHGPEDGCACRKPAPGLVLEAARALGVDPAGCVVVGDIGADVEAALAAGASAILVPTPVTRPEEVDAAPVVAVDLEEAVGLLLDGGR